MLTIDPIEAVGAELRGVDLAELDALGFTALHAALLAHGLLIVRGQSLDHAQHVALARRFGPLETLGREMGTPHPEIIAITNLAEDGSLLPRSDPLMSLLSVNERWHTDSSFREIPSSVSVFRAERVPPNGGDTFYASLRRGWLELEPHERTEYESLRLVHDYGRSAKRLGSWMPDRIEEAPVVHPLVRRHPETGESCLYLSDHALRVEGMSEAEGRALIERLLEHCAREEWVYRHVWSPGDVALWDNRCMLHRAQGFDEEHPRLMYHVRVEGSAV